MKLTAIGISGGMCVALALVASGCSDSSSSSGIHPAAASAAGSSRSICGAQDEAQLRIATAFPLTGDDVANGPSATAGTQLALKDIGAAGGVLGSPPILTTVEDSGDSESLEPSTAAADQIMKDRAAVVIGPLGAIPTLNMADTLARGCVTDLAMSDLSDVAGTHKSNVFQLAATDAELGGVLAGQLAKDQRSKVAFVTYDDAFDQGVRDAAVTQVRSSGARVVYGGRTGVTSSALEETDFPTAAEDAVRAGADAYVVLAYGESSGAIANLISAGAKPDQIYLAGPNVISYQDTLAPASLRGATGVLYGSAPDPQFAARLATAFQGKVDPVLAAQTYDATVLAALAAQQGKSTRGDVIWKNLSSVSGADGGQACDSFEQCSQLLAQGEQIHYSGVSQNAPFNDEQNASSHTFGIYRYDRANAPVRVATVKGAEQ